jgi:tetratricopeptide (TPR) repeat protein
MEDEDNDVKVLEEEISRYKNRKEYAECVKRMDEHVKETINPVVRAIALMAKCTCAAQMNDLALAENAAFAIDMEPLSPEMRNYVNLVRADVLSLIGESKEAESLFFTILTSKEQYSEQMRDVLYQASAKLGILYVTWKRYSQALTLLEKASLLMPDGYLRDYVDIDLAYCLQSLGRADEAKGCLKSIIDRGPEEFIVDAYYRLGAIQLQTGECEAAIDSFQSALNNLPRGKIAESDILTALREAKEQQSIDAFDRTLVNTRNKPRTQ